MSEAVFMTDDDGVVCEKSAGGLRGLAVIELCTVPDRPIVLAKGGT